MNVCKKWEICETEKTGERGRNDGERIKDKEEGEGRERERERWGDKKEK